MTDRWPLVEFLLCAADLARMGEPWPLSDTYQAFGAHEEAWQLHYDACRLLHDVYRGYRDVSHERLADYCLEAAYRWAESRDVP